MGSDTNQFESYVILLLKPTKQTSFDICFCFAVFLQIMETNKRHFLLFCVFCLKCHKTGSFCFCCRKYHMLNNTKKYLFVSYFTATFVGTKKYNNENSNMY